MIYEYTDVQDIPISEGLTVDRVRPTSVTYYMMPYGEKMQIE